MDTDFEAGKESLIRLTDQLYQLTLLFPRKESLRYKVREQADDILSGFVSAIRDLEREDRPSLRQDLLKGLKAFDSLDSFLDISSRQNWVSEARVSKVKESYLRAKELFLQLGEEKPEKQGKETKTIEGVRVDAKLNDRQKKILNILKEKGQAQVWQLKAVFPEVSKRTLRRDFEQLFGQNLVERIGERNNTFYRLAG